MNQPSREPEYTVVESEKILHTENKPVCITRDWLTAVVVLEELCLEASRLADTCLNTVDRLQVLVVSLQERM